MTPCIRGIPGMFLWLFFASAFFVSAAEYVDSSGKNKSSLAVASSSPSDQMLVSENGATFTVIRWGKAGDIPVPADYDGDGKADLAMFSPSNATWQVRGSSGASWSRPWGASGDIPVPGDYDGDDHTDLAVFRPAEATWHILGSGGTASTNSWGASGEIPVPADYDGDGKWDYASFRPSEGKWFITSLGKKWVAPWGKPGDSPLPADFDGDGKADAATFRATEGHWYVSVHGWNRWLIPLGTVEDIPFVGDYNGDGKSDVAVWRPASGEFHISFIGGGKEIIPWGNSGDIPVPADYDGDGKVNLAVFRPTEGTWHILLNDRKSSSKEDLKYNSRRWQTQDGLPHSFVNTILQTRDGYLWMGTPAGLVRFDGLRFTPVSEVKGGIRLLYQTRDGIMWITPEKEGLFPSKNQEFTSGSIIGNKQVRALFEDRDGVLWIGTTGGLGRYQDGKCNWFGQTNGLADDVVLALCGDQNGSLWIGTGAGLNSYKEGTFERHVDVLTNAVRALFCDRKNNVWVGTGTRGVVRIASDGIQYFSTADGLPDPFVSTIFENNQDELWVGTSSGLCRWTGEKFATELNSEGASYETILSLTGDSEGSLWLGTKEGLTQLWRKPFKAYTSAQGLPRNNVMSVCEDSRSNIWFTTWGGGLGKFRNGRFVSYNSTNRPLHDVLLSCCETRDGSLWIGADFDGGLFRFRRGTFTRFGKKEGLIDPAVRVIYEDRKGDLWIGANGGLYQRPREEEKFNRFTTSDGLSGNIIRALFEDHAGNLWIGTSEGLTRRSNESFSKFSTKDGLSANAIFSIFEDRGHTLWIGTDGGGLVRVRQVEGQRPDFRAYRKRDGLLSDTIFEILEDDRGYLWMSCVSGVFRIAKKDLDDFDRGTINAVRCASFGDADGMASAQCNGVSKPAGWKGKDGRLWFPTTRGIVVVDSNLVSDNHAPPPVVIEKVFSDRQAQSLKFKIAGHGQGGQDSVVNFERETLDLAPGRGELEIHYTALSYTAPEKNRFRYRLKGVDPDWVDADMRRIAYYNNIKPGAYTFQVVGCNNDGVWNDSGSSLNLILRPHFYQTTWFLVLMALTSVGLVGGVARYLTWKKVQQKLLIFEQQHAIEKERTRIAQDMHDDLGVRLTEVLLVGERASAPETALEETKTLVRKNSRSIHEVVESLDAIVWAVNPKNDSLHRFIPYIREYIQTFLEPTSVRFTVDIPSEIPDAPLSSETRHHLYMVIREALNNIVKHSSASEMKFSLRIEESELKIDIDDNGKGFVPESSSMFGNGLSNMEKRIKQIGGRLRIESALRKGTHLHLNILLR